MCWQVLEQQAQASAGQQQPLGPLGNRLASWALLLTQVCPFETSRMKIGDADCGCYSVGHNPCIIRHMNKFNYWPSTHTYFNSCAEAVQTGNTEPDTAALAAGTNESNAADLDREHEPQPTIETAAVTAAPSASPSNLDETPVTEAPGNSRLH